MYEEVNVFDGRRVKQFRSPEYNWNLDKETGLFIRWGETIEDDPSFSPYGPEILDLEISTGGCSGNCPWCYKSNTKGKGTNMKLDTFRDILDRFMVNVVRLDDTYIGLEHQKPWANDKYRAPLNLGQVAFGITDADANPDFPDMLEYCNEVGIVPNYTTSGYGMTDSLFDLTSRVCGAVAVSVYPHQKELALSTIREFVDRGMEQVNAHLLYWVDNIEFLKGVMSELSGLNAAVLLALKPVGRASDMQPASYSDMKELIEYAMAINLPLGFDSCSAPKFERWVWEDSGWSDVKQSRAVIMSESCESTLFSSYINVHGQFWPCSFTEGQEWTRPIDVLKCKNWMDFWYHPATNKFRNKLLSTVDSYGTRHCPAFRI